MTASGAPPGWYPDPEILGGRRYFDGAAWTEHRIAPDPPPYPGPAWWGPPPWKGARLGRPAQGAGALADPGRRLGARVLDALLLLPVAAGFTAIALAIVIPRAGPLFPTINADSNATPFPGIFWIYLAIFASVVATGLVLILYETIATVRYGRTFGKAWLHIRPVRTDGKTLGWGRSFGRIALYWGSGLLNWIGLLDPLWCLWDENRQCLHDKVTDTIVINDLSPDLANWPPQALPWSPQTPSPQFWPPYGFGAPGLGRVSTNGLSIASLVCSLLGLLLFGVPAILGVIFGFVGRAQIGRSRGTQTGEGLALAGIIVGFVVIAFWVLIVVVGAVARHELNQPVAIPSASGYTTYTGPDGEPLAVGEPWGTRCQPIVFSVAANVPNDVYDQIRQVIDQARVKGVDVTVENRQFEWLTGDLYPPGLGPANVKLVPIFVNATSSPSLPDGQPEHINFGWDARPTADGSHEMLTSLQGTLYLKNLGSHSAAIRLAIRQLVAFSQGIGASTASGSGIVRGSTVDTFSPGDIAAMQRMSGCVFEPLVEN